MARLLMGNAEWAFFEPFITGIRGRGGRPAGNHRQVLDGIFWIARTGSQWRDLPEEFGKWSSVYRQFRRWTLAGLWDLIVGLPLLGLAFVLYLAANAARRKAREIDVRRQQGG